MHELGQTDPIRLGKIAEDEDFILDGHNRMRICKKIGVDPHYFDGIIKFENISEAKLWIINNQLSRRNLSPFQRGEAILMKEDIFLVQAKERMLAGIKTDPTPTLGEGGETIKLLAREADISHDTLSKIKKLQEKATPEVLDKLRCADISINKAYTDIQKKEIRERNEELKRNNPIPIPEGKYQTIVIDPPWDIEKIGDECDVHRPALEYPTMKNEELLEFPLQDWAADNCHLYLWVTHSSLPFGLELLKKWGFNYSCVLTWRKNVGMTPFSWMYSTEHVLFARKGSLKLLKIGKRLDFMADRTGHSRKPDVFYSLVEEVSPEPRIDIFSREKRNGFDQFGNEKRKFSEEQKSLVTAI